MKKRQKDKNMLTRRVLTKCYHLTVLVFLFQRYVTC